MRGEDAAHLNVGPELAEARAPVQPGRSAGGAFSHRLSAFRQNPCPMAHFSARPRLMLAVEVKGHAGFPQELRPGIGLRADQIAHFDPAVAAR